MKKINQSALINALSLSNSNTVFLLGAGCSISSGCFSSKRMVENFTKRIYCLEKGLSISQSNYISHDELLAKATDYINKKYQECSNNYSRLFELCFPLPEVRNKYIIKNFSNQKPSLGYLCFANYLLSRGIKRVLTTNFDNLIQKAIAKINEEIEVVIASDNQKPKNDDAFTVVKLHGDYNYDGLQNTDDELKSLSENLINQLNAVNMDGIVVIGYAGVDKSVLDFLNNYFLNHKRAKLFWCILEGDSINDNVSKLLDEFDSYLVEIDGFDELFYRYYKVEGPKNKYIDSILEDKQTDPFAFESILNQPQRFSSNVYPISTPFSVWKVNGNYKQLDIVNGYCAPIAKNNSTYFIGDVSSFCRSNSVNINSISNVNVIDNSDLLLIEKCKLIKESIFMDLSNRDVQRFKDIAYHCDSSGLQKGIRITVDGLFGNICLVLNSEVFYPKQELSLYEKGEIRNTKANPKNDNWLKQFASLKKEILSDSLAFANGACSFSFSSSPINNSNENIVRNYTKVSEPEMKCNNCTGINQIALLGRNGPLETRFSKDNISVGVLCLEEDKTRLTNFLELFKNGSNQRPKDNMIQYTGFTNLFKKEICFNFNCLNSIIKESMFLNKTFDRIMEFVEEAVKRIYENIGIDIVLIYFSNRLEKYRSEENKDFHDLLKIHCSQKFKTQIITDKAISGGDDINGTLFSLATAIYTKTIGMPWAPKEEERGTVYLGMSFGVSQKEGVVTGCSQLFDSAGRGLKLIVSPIKDKSNGAFKMKNQYLSRQEAYEFGTKILRIYNSQVPDNVPIRKIIIHRNSPFKKEEIDGFKEAFFGIDGFELIQLILGTDVKIFPYRNDDSFDGYPIERGTILVSSKNSAYLWTDGSLKGGNVIKTFRPVVNSVASPIKIVRYYGKSSIESIAKSILSLTHMDFNSASRMCGKIPVTTKYSDLVCDYLKQGNFDEESISFVYIM